MKLNLASLFSSFPTGPDLAVMTFFTISGKAALWRGGCPLWLLLAQEQLQLESLVHSTIVAEPHVALSSRELRNLPTT